MKNSVRDLESVRDSVVIVRCRDLTLGATDRKELHRSEVALGHVFQLIHRVEWRLTGQPDAVEVSCRIRSRTGEFAASGIGVNARAAVQAALAKILKQKRLAKETSVTRRRSTPKGPRAA